MTHSRLSQTAAVIGLVMLLLTLTGIAFANPSAQQPPGTIRGGVYQDVDGDGKCVDDQFEDRRPAPGVDIHFSTDGAFFSLYSGTDGTYGLIPVSPGSWSVTVKPRAGEWLVTSPKTLRVQVTPGQGAVQTEVNFCLLRLNRPSIISLPLGSVRSIDAPVIGQAGFPAAAAPAGQGSEEPASTLMISDPFVEKAIISELLLTNPPEPRPPEDLAATLEVPVDTNAPPVAEWLGYLNLIRESSGLPLLAEAEPLTYGSQWHSRYIVVNDQPIAHNEDKANALYDPAGNQAAINGNIFATTQFEAGYTWAVNFWISAPFHLTPIIDPALESVGFGRHNEEVGTFNMAAVLDVRSGLGDVPAGTSYPIYFPGDGAATWVVRHSLYEWPDAMDSCPGYSRPSGPPLVLQLGDGDLTPSVSGHALYLNDQLLESCLFDETSYHNPKPFAQSAGRTILDERDAIVIIPRRPLAIGETYRVEVTAGGQLYSWRFETQRGPDG